MGGVDGAPDDCVDDVHYYVDGGDDVGGVAVDGLAHVEGQAGRVFVELEGFFDGAPEEEGREDVVGLDELVGDLPAEVGLDEELGNGEGGIIRGSGVLVEVSTMIRERERGV